MAVGIVHFGCLQFRCNLECLVDAECARSGAFCQIVKLFLNSPNLRFSRCGICEEMFNNAELQKSGVLFLLNTHVEP